MTTSGLNRSQRTALAVTLEQLEQSVNEIERTLTDAPAGATYATVVDVPPDALQQMRQQCAAVREQVAEIAAAFALPQRRSSVRQLIGAEMSAAWSHLEDLRPSKLRRYGGVDPSLERTLMPRIERLIRLVQAMGELARGEASNEVTNE